MKYCKRLFPIRFELWMKYRQWNGPQGSGWPGLGSWLLIRLCSDYSQCSRRDGKLQGPDQNFDTSQHQLSKKKKKISVQCFCKMLMCILSFLPYNLSRESLFIPWIIVPYQCNMVCNILVFTGSVHGLSHMLFGGTKPLPVLWILQEIIYA